MPVKKKSCTVDGIRYESESVAAKALGVDVGVLKIRLRSSNFPNYTSKHRPKVKRRKKVVSTSCTIQGVKYVSVADAARKLGKSATTIFKRLRSFDFPDYVSANVPKIAKPIKYNYTVNGRNYRTLQEIADEEGLTRERIRQKVNDPKYSGYRRL